MLHIPIYKENTGFCCRCRQWKLLVHDRFQSNHGPRGKKKSSYCIRCDEVIKASEAMTRKLRRKTHDTSLYSHQFPGHEDRISYHQKRVHIEQCLLNGKPFALEGEAA